MSALIKELTDPDGWLYGYTGGEIRFGSTAPFKAADAIKACVAFLKNERELELELGYPPVDDLRIKRIDDLLRELGE